MLTLSLTLALAVGAQASMNTVAEKARAAKQHATEIEAMLKTKNMDAAQVAEKAKLLHSHAVEIHETVSSMDRANAEIARVQDAAQILKVLTESKLNLAQNATAKDRDALRASAKNLAIRAEQIAKTASKIGG
jgi:predicted transposase YbfD/YdcC